MRLVKTDTDGFDVGLLPALAAAFAGSRPVLFFEYDVRLTRLAAPGLDPFAVWGQLAGLGYDLAAVWHNHGHALGHAPTSAIAAPARTLDPPGAGRDDPSYWDVAVAHRDDPVGQAALRTLAPQPFAPSLAVPASRRHGTRVRAVCAGRTARSRRSAGAAGG